MSRRYGRNQRRKHHAEIARLQQELDHAQTRGFQPATGQFPKLEDLIGTSIISMRDNTTEDGFTARREAEIEFYVECYEKLKKLQYHYAYSGAVEWKGITWQLQIPEMNVGMFRDASIASVTLLALGRRNYRPRTNYMNPSRSIAA